MLRAALRICRVIAVLMVTSGRFARGTVNESGQSCPGSAFLCKATSIHRNLDCLGIEGFNLEPDA